MAREEPTPQEAWCYLHRVTRFAPCTRLLASFTPLLLLALDGCEPPVVEEASIVLPPRVDPPASSDAGGGNGDASAPSCAAPLTTCAGSCVDLKKDDQSCGRCGRACGTGSSCS